MATALSLGVEKTGGSVQKEKTRNCHVGLKGEEKVVIFKNEPWGDLGWKPKVERKIKRYFVSMGDQYPRLKGGGLIYRLYFEIFLCPHGKTKVPGKAGKSDTRQQGF